MAVGLRGEQRARHHAAQLGAVPAAAPPAVEAHGRVAAAGAGGRHVAVVVVGAAASGPAVHTADCAEAAPQQDGGDEQQQHAAGQPHPHGQLPARPLVAVAALAGRAEHLALVPHRVGRLARHAEEVGGLRLQVAQVHAGLADGDALFVLEALALVAHEQAVPVGVVHDAVEGVQAARRRGPAHPGRGGGDVVHHHSHDARLLPPGGGSYWGFFSSSGILISQQG